MKSCPKHVLLLSLFFPHVILISSHILRVTTPSSRVANAADGTKGVSIQVKGESNNLQ